MIKRFTLYLLTALLITPIITPTALAQPTPANTLSIQAAFEFSSLDPSRSGYVFTRMQVLETLLNVDASGRLTDGLASEWQIREQGRAWELTLRPGVKFHDGSALTADIVVDNLKQAAAKPGPLQKVPLNSISAIDDDTILIELDSPYRPLGAILAHYSTAILAASAVDDNKQVVELVGTGPFSAYEVNVPHRLVVKRFDDYWGKKAEIEFASYLTGHRAEARVLQARSGQADIVFGLDPAAVPMLKRLPNLEIISSDLPRSLVLKLNLGHPFLKDRATRQALSLGINRKGIATAILHSPDSASGQLLPPYMSDWYLEGVSSQQDTEEAARLLEAEGWKKGDSGWLERDGQTFELTLITYADRPELTTVATAIQDQLRQLGIKLNINVTNSSSIPAGHEDGSLEMALIARNYGIVADPLAILINDFGSEKGGDWGSMNWKNTDVQQTLRGLVEATNAEDYRRQAQSVARAIQEDIPLITIAYYVQQTAVNQRVDGFRFDPYERNYFLNELSRANE